LPNNFHFGGGKSNKSPKLGVIASKFDCGARHLSFRNMPRRDLIFNSFHPNPATLRGGAEPDDLETVSLPLNKEASQSVRGGVYAS
jgi:hypothetical protein